MHCQVLIKQHQELAAVVLQQYQAVFKRLEEDQEFMEGVMILAQKERVEVELKRFEDIWRLNLKDGVTEALLDSSTFATVVEPFEQGCPMIDDILKTLLITESARRSIIKTLSIRRRGINALACLLSVQNQRCENDINLAFGMICDMVVGSNL